MNAVNEEILMTWLGYEDSQHYLTTSEARRLLNEGSVIVDTEGLAFYGHGGHLYSAELRLEGYKWHKCDKNTCPVSPCCRWIDIDSPEGLDVMLDELDRETEEAPASSFHGEEDMTPMTEVLRNVYSSHDPAVIPCGDLAEIVSDRPVVYRENGPILERIADSLDDLVLAVTASVAMGVTICDLPPRLREILDRGGKKN